MVVALTSPVVIAMSLIHRSWSLSSTDRPCTPAFATVPPDGRVRCTCRRQRDPDRLNRHVHAQAVGHRHHFFFHEALPLLTPSVAPRPRAWSSRLSSRSMAMTRDAP